eukprot:6154165-Pyramimonas_sp.AAC.1
MLVSGNVCQLPPADELAPPQFVLVPTVPGVWASEVLAPLAPAAPVLPARAPPPDRVPAVLPA